MNSRDNFGELFIKIYPDVDKIVWKYDGMLLTKQLQDSIKCDLYNYKQSLKQKLCIEEQQLERVIKSCYNEAVRRLEEENSMYDEEFENSFVCQCLKEEQTDKEDVFISVCDDVTKQQEEQNGK